ncbi:MAG TPA: FeoA domain-containing protein [Oscillospiraceae bacterium]|nr:FeoA domain-containing protein [Oscillospiraceae bacterium]
MNTPLSQLNPGKKGKVEKIDACRYATKRLYEMGFNIGATFEVVKNDRGPIVVSLFGNNIAVGRCLAQKIIVSQSN